MRFSEPMSGVIASLTRDVVDVLIGAAHYLYYPANIVQWLMPPQQVASSARPPGLADLETKRRPPGTSFLTDSLKDATAQYEKP
jgi:hypothetical protein